MAFRAMDYYLFALNKYLDLGYSYDQAEALAKNQTAKVSQRVLKEQDDKKSSSKIAEKQGENQSTQA